MKLLEKLINISVYIGNKCKYITDVNYFKMLFYNILHISNKHFHFYIQYLGY